MADMVVDREKVMYMISCFLIVACNLIPILANDFPGDKKTNYYKLFKSWNEVLPSVAKDLTDLFMENY